MAASVHLFEESRVLVADKDGGHAIAVLQALDDALGRAFPVQDGVLAEYRGQEIAREVDDGGFSALGRIDDIARPKHEATPLRGRCEMNAGPWTGERGEDAKRHQLVRLWVCVGALLQVLDVLRDEGIRRRDDRELLDSCIV